MVGDCGGGKIVDNHEVNSLPFLDGNEKGGGGKLYIKNHQSNDRT